MGLYITLEVVRSSFVEAARGHLLEEANLACLVKEGRARCFHLFAKWADPDAWGSLEVAIEEASHWVASATSSSTMALAVLPIMIVKSPHFTC